MSADVVDEESRLALLGSIGIQGEPERVAQSDEEMNDGKELKCTNDVGFVRENG